MESIVSKIQTILKHYNYTITCAESCTGGLIASAITDIPGSSHIFKGSIVVYSNQIKEQELGVKKETLLQYDAVSTETVKEMLDGILKKFNATYAIAVSGVAGPNGGTESKPVGTVIIGIKNIFKEEKIQTFHFAGDRKKIRESAVDSAFEMILENLQNLS